MLKNIKKGERIFIEDYAIEFTDEDGNGFTFSCDANGNLLPLTPQAEQNYKYCIQNPQKFYNNEIFVDYSRYYKEPDYGECICGEIVYLENEYMGACQCPNCGRWYNLFGQSLIDPKYWEDEE